MHNYNMKLAVFLLIFTVILPKYYYCEKPDPKNWWKTAVLYQIYPRSFLDTDGDGVGDLKGIESKLDYVKHLGVHGTWLSPIYDSPMKDFGYDISNYTSIDPLFGTMKDFDSFVKKSKEKGLKVILDYVPNHTSNESEWFKKSERREEPYTDYYIWANGKDSPKGSQPPSNWVSVFGGSAWEWSPIRKQFYYHAFLKEQPDLNYTNPKVVEEMKNVIRFWFNKGVDGFRIDAVLFLFEDPLLRDEPPIPGSKAKPTDYSYYNHIYTFNLPNIIKIITGWREVFQEYEKQDGEHRVMILETGLNATQTLPYFGNNTYPLADMPFNFQLIYQLKGMVSGEDVYKAVWDWIKYIPDTKWSNWVLGNHDQHRVANRTHVDLIDAFNMISILLKGTPVSYYGEEIGMVDTFVSYNQTQDPAGKKYGPKEYMKYSRDPQRTPMQWDDSPFAGFTRGNKTWLPVNDNYMRFNVKREKFAPRSHLNTYRKLVALKKEKSIINGSVEFPLVTKDIFSFTRALKSYPGYVIVVNFGNDTQTVSLANKETKEFRIPLHGIVEVMSDKLWQSLAKSLEFKINLAKIKLPPRQGMVIKFRPEWKH